MSELINVPSDVLYIMNRIEKNGGEAYAVGGCVRDSLLGKTPYDWDITTDVSPNDTEKIFNDFNVIETGLKHGTVTVRLNGTNYEITTFRTDGTYSDSRRPDSVNFVKDLGEDLARRDFTINAMAYNPKCGIVDLFDGMSDLKNKTIRCVGNAEKRFSEDALRILRALRFSSTLGFKIESECRNAIFKKVDALKYISAERIKSEFFKMIIGINFKYVCNDFCDIIDNVIYGIKCRNLDGVFFEKASDYEPYTVFAAAIRMSGCDNTTKCCSNLKLSNFERGVVKLSKFDPCLKDRVSILRFMSDMSEESFDILLDIWDLCGENTDLYRDVKYYAKSNNICYHLNQLCISGVDVMKFTSFAGKDVGKILKLCMDEVINGNICNTRDELIEFIKEIKIP